MVGSKYGTALVPYCDLANAMEGGGTGAVNQSRSDFNRLLVGRRAFVRLTAGKSPSWVIKTLSTLDRTNNSGG